MAQGRDIMKGRHNVGGRTGSAGKIPRGQSEPASNKGGGITGSRTFMQSTPPVKSTHQTSLEGEKLAKQPPMPFQNERGTVKTPAPSGPRGAVPGPAQKPYAGLQHSSPGVKALPSGGPVGQRKPINQSGQIGGHMGWPPPARKAGAVPKQPNKRNARFYGE